MISIVRQHGRTILLYSFFIIFVSVLFNEIIFHVFLHPEQQTPEFHHIPIGTAGISIAVIMIAFMTWFVGKRSELARVNTEWEQTFNSLSEFVSVHDRNFRILKVNNALCELLGREREELVGRYCYEIFHKTKKPIADCPHVKSMETADAISTEVFDENIGIPLHVTCSPFFDQNRKFQGSIHTARPVTGAANLSKPEKSQQEDAEDHIAVCAWCKDVRGKDGRWGNLFDYIYENSRIKFTHGICTECKDKVQPIIDQQ